MQIDIGDQLRAVRRQVEIRSSAADSGSVPATIALEQRFAVPLAELWSACTTPERLAHWFAPVTGDLREGGNYAIEGNASGSITACSPDRFFRLSWEFGGEASTVEVEFAPADGGVRLRLSHAADTPREFWERYGAGATGVGWDLTLIGLSHYVATGSRRPLEVSSWYTSSQARRFIHGASERWAAQAVAAGVPEAAAAAAAARTSAFYLGEGEDEPTGASEPSPLDSDRAGGL
jgi:uncharacterized protein YndB with AHSA1/START domain